MKVNSTISSSEDTAHNKKRKAKHDYGTDPLSRLFQAGLWYSPEYGKHFYTHGNVARSKRTAQRRRNIQLHKG